MKSESRRLGLNTIFNTVGGIAVQVLTVFTGVFVARHLGAHGFGQLTLAATVTGYFTLVTEFGLTTIAVRTIARTGDPERYIVSYLVTRLGLSCLALLVLAGILAVVHYPLDTTLLIGAYACTIPLQILKVNWIFYATQNMFLDNVLQVLEKVAYAASLFLLVLVVKGALFVPMAMIASSLVVATLSWGLFLKRKKRPIDFALHRAFMKELVTQGWPVGVAGAALQTNSNADSIFVNAYRGNLETGLYGAAYRLINAVITAGTFFTNAVYPVSCRRYHESGPSFGAFTDYASKLLLLLTVPGVIILSALSDDITGLLFGRGYAGAAVPFRILVWGSGIAVVCRLYHNTLVACDRQQSFMKIIVATALFNLACNFLLIPRYGMLGAAVATVATEILLFVLTVSRLCRILELRLWQGAALVALCAALASGAFFLPVHHLAQPFFFIAAYLVLVVLFGVCGSREWQLVRGIYGRGLSAS